MIVIRGIYDGETIRPAPDELLPEVEGEVPVENTLPYAIPIPPPRLAQSPELAPSEARFDGDLTLLNQRACGI